METMETTKCLRIEARFNKFKGIYIGAYYPATGSQVIKEYFMTICDLF